MRILITDGMDKSSIAALKEKGHEIVEQFYEPGELGAALRDFDAVIIRSATKIRKAQLEVAKDSEEEYEYGAASGGGNVYDGTFLAGRKTLEGRIHGCRPAVCFSCVFICPACESS